MWLVVAEIKEEEGIGNGSISKECRESRTEAPKRKETRYDVTGVIINVYTKYSKLQLQVPARMQ